MKSVEKLTSNFILVAEKHAEHIKVALEKLKKEMQFEIDHDDYSEEYAKKNEQYMYAYDNLITQEPYMTYISLCTASMIYYYDGKEKDVYDFFTKKEKKHAYPNDFKELFKVIGVDDERWGFDALGRFMGLGHNECGLQYNPTYIKNNKILFKKMSDLFPPFILNRAAFFCTINAEQFLFTWLLNKDDKTETGEILILDIVDRTIGRLSNDMASFLLRGLECMKIEQVQNIYEPSEEVLQIIRNIDGDNVLPNESAVYELDELDSFPEEWKVMLTEEDYDFEL